MKTDGTAVEKQIYCGLRTHTDYNWMGSIVTLTLEEEGGSGSIICNVIPEDGDTLASFRCTGSASKIKHFPEISTEVSLTADLADDVDSTTIFRCSVEVGPNSDGKTADTKLIYFQKIREFQVYHYISYFKALQ